MLVMKKVLLCSVVRYVIRDWGRTCSNVKAAIAALRDNDGCPSLQDVQYAMELLMRIPNWGHGALLLHVGVRNDFEKISDKGCPPL